jgi:O-acetyl-ADP-ribose deacetylase
MERPTKYLDGRVIVKTGDITEENADAIVNAANSSLMGGGGVDGAIHRAGGPEIIEECRELRKTRFPSGLPAGQAVATTAGKLPVKYVIHTVGPVWHSGLHDEHKLLAECYRNSLETGALLGCETVAFPAISTGVYGYPKDKAARTASRAVKSFLESDKTIKEVRFIFFSDTDRDIFERECEF